MGDKGAFLARRRMMEDVEKNNATDGPATEEPKGVSAMAAAFGGLSTKSSSAGTVAKSPSKTPSGPGVSGARFFGSPLASAPGPQSGDSSPQTGPPLPGGLTTKVAERRQQIDKSVNQAQAQKRMEKVASNANKGEDEFKKLMEARRVKTDGATPPSSE